MGTIIHLNALQRTTVPQAAGEMPARCEIVIFPGVRIERVETPCFDDGSTEPETGTGNGHRPRKSS